MSSGSWVTCKTDSPTRSPTVMSCIRRRVAASSAEKGSSSRASGAFSIRARGKARRWRCPPYWLSGERLAKPATPTEATSAKPWVLLGRCSRRCWPIRTLLSTDRRGCKRSSCAVSATWSGVVVCPLNRTWVGTPDKGRGTVVLPAPEGPSRQVHRVGKSNVSGPKRG